MNKRLKKCWIVTQMITIILSIFFALYIPSMYFNFEFLKMISNQSGILESLFVFFMISFGLFFISLAVAGKCLYYYDDLFKWSEQFDKML